MMSRKLVRRTVALIFTALAAPLPVSASVITFDDLDATAGDVSLDAISPYQGFTWNNFFAYTNTPGFPGFNNGIVSGPNAAYSGGQFFDTAVEPVIGSISSTSLFDFDSAEIGAGYYDGLAVTLTGLRAGSIVYTQTVTVGTTGALPFTFDFRGIDTLQIQGSSTAATNDPYACGIFDCTLFTVDDLTVVPSDVVAQPVPEPSSALLSLLGLAGLATTRWSRERRRGKRTSPSGLVD